MDADQREVVVRVPRVLVGGQELVADEHGVQPADEDEHADADEVLQPDHLVVRAQPEVTADAPGLLLAKAGRLAEQAHHRVVRKTEPDQEAEHPGEVRAEQRDVVLPRVAEVIDALAVDLMAEHPPDVEPDEPEYHGAEQVEAEEAAHGQPARPVGCGL